MLNEGFDILARSVALNVLHHSDDHPDPPKCHENTRVAVINKYRHILPLAVWARWRRLQSLNGARSSAVSLQVSCFFRTDSQRNTVKSFVASIAYCIALVVPGSKPIIEVVEVDPLIFQYSLETQRTKVVFEPSRSC